MGLVALALGGTGAVLILKPDDGPRVLPMGQLVIESSPPGASVRIGGRALVGVTPLVADHLAPGPVEVEARLAGTQGAKELVDIRAGSAQNLRLTLPILDVRITVTSVPSGAALYMDGTLLGRTPTEVTLRGSERATLRGELEGHEPAVKIVDGAHPPNALSFVLRKAVPVAATTPSEAAPVRPKPRAGVRKDDDASTGTGWLTLRSDPWARVYLDGKDSERFTPVAEWALPAGKHMVRLVNDEEGLSATFPVVITAGQTVKVSRELK
jgi:hypothetical protein